MTPRVEAEIVPEAADDWATPISHHAEDGLPVTSQGTAANEPAAIAARAPLATGGAATAPGVAAGPRGDVLQIPHRGLITATVVMTSMMQALDNTIANVALPHIQGSLSATQDQMAWVLTSYIVAAAIMTPMSGWLAGRFGRKRIILMSIAGFTLASMLCGIAQSLPQMVLARLLQGACGAALVPMSQAVMLDIYPGEQLAKAMSIWVTGITVGPIMGPALGGWLTDNHNWRWVFYINVPFGIIAFLGTLATLPKSTMRKSPFDFFGFATLSLGVGATQITLDRGRLKDWVNSPEICIEAAVSAAAFYLFVVHMMTTRKTRFVDPALFKDRTFLAWLAFIFTVGLLL